MNTSRVLFQEFIQSETPDTKSDFLNKILSNSYTNLRYLAEELTESIRRAEEVDFPFVEEWIRRAQELIPEPSHISPYYQSVWERLAKTLNYKREAYAAISKDRRPGEWQLVYNNPNTNEDLLCIPSLSFNEACFLYGKYRLDLKQAEILRLQKVVDQLTTAGERE